MEQSVAILGRQPALGLAELESLYGASQLQPVGSDAALLGVAAADVAFDRLGGTVKLGKVITTVNGTDWAQIIKYLDDRLPSLLNALPEGKIRLGLSVHGLPIKPATINRSGLALKKTVKRLGKSVRVVPNTAQQLNSAQAIHNQLTGPTGLEFLIIKYGKKSIIAQTTNVQDINAYSSRDQARPKRDARVGMLPPKLAQIIVNLANPQPGQTVLDPFCGTGVILQEALLMGYGVYGSDLEPRMVDYSKANLDWLRPGNNAQLEVGDATNHHWQPLPDRLAAETYLGRPFSAQPDAQTLGQVMRGTDTIHRKFLKNLAAQCQAGTRACLAVPAWFTPSGVKHLTTLDSLEELGYTRMSFVHASAADLIYHRQGQVVGRELLVITRN